MHKNLAPIALLAAKPVCEAPGLMLRPLPEGYLLQIIGTDDEGMLADRLGQAGLEGFSLRKAGTGQWYVAGDVALDKEMMSRLATAFEGLAHLSDQSHGRVRFSLSGARAEQFLASWTAVDLHPASFAVGQATVTLMGHTPAHLTRLGSDHFEITVLRSYAEDLYDSMAHRIA